MTCQRNAARYKRDTAQYGERGDGGRGIGFQRTRARDFFGEYVFRHAGDGVAD